MAITFKIPRAATAVSSKNTPVPPGHEHRTSIDAVGKDLEDYPFPSSDEIVRRALKRAAKAERRAQKRLRKAGKSPKTDSNKITAIDGDRSLIDNLVLPKPAMVIPAGLTRETYLAGQILLKSADGLQELMMTRMFDGFYEERFGDMTSVFAWGVIHMPPNKVPAVKSLSRQLEKLRLSYSKALPDLTAKLAKKNPKAPLQAVINKAVELIDQELARIIYILSIYAESVKQARDGRFVTELNAVETLFQDIFRLYFTGDLHCTPDGKKAPVQLPSSTYSVGNVFMSRVTSGGLATIPGAKGPVGANALQLPFEMLDIVCLLFDLLGHEARHNIFHDLIGLEEEFPKALNKAILDAHSAGIVKLLREDMLLGEQAVKTIELIAKLMCDWLGEIDADVVGGVLFSGPSFGDTMAMSFPAMMVRDGRVSTKVKLLRTGSVYHLVPQPDGNIGLVFEAHPVDYIRMYIVAAALEEIGFKAHATKLRQLADFAVGDEIPAEITFKEADEQSAMVIKFATADLLAVVGVVAKTIIRTPLVAQLGKSCGDLVMFNDKRQGKVDVLTDLLAAGVSELPTNIGSIFANYVGAAASQAYLKLVREGKMTAVAAAKLVNGAALKMIAGLSSLAANQCPVPSQPAA